MTTLRRKLPSPGRKSHEPAPRTGRFVKECAALALILSATVTAGCQGRNAPAQSPELPVLPDDRNLIPTSEPTPASKVKSLRVAELSGAALGPRLLKTSRGSLAVWADLHEAEGVLLSRVITADGRASSVSRLLQTSPSIRMLQLGATGTGGVLATTVRRSGERDALEAVLLGPGGELRGGSYLLADTPAQVLFTQIVPTARGALVFWVEKVQKRADLWACSVEAPGPKRPVRLATDVSAWQIVDTSSGAAVATREGTGDPSILLRQVGDAGQLLGSVVPIARSVKGGLDLDVGVTSARLIVAYTERQGAGSHVVVSTLDLSGNVLTTPTPLTKNRGTQALLRLLGSQKDDTFVAVWEEPLYYAHGLPSLFVGRGKGDTAVEPSFAFSSSRKDALLPAFVPHDGGLLLLTDESICPLLGESDCQASEGRFAMAFDEHLGVGRPIRFSEGPIPPVLSWDPVCDGNTCELLTAQQNGQTQVDLLRFEPAKFDSSRSEFGAWSFNTDLPRVVRRDDLGPVPELAALAAGISHASPPMSSGASASSVDASGVDASSSPELVSWISYFDPERPPVTLKTPTPDGRTAPVQAQLTNVAVRAEADALSSSQQVISYRAGSFGKLALVPPQGGSGLLAWAALDNGDPQLFATIIDAKGARIRQKMLTRTEGQVYDVAATRVPSGYLISWVDGRAPAPEVYALIVDEQLNAKSPAVQVSHGARAPADTSLMVLSDQVLVVWSDARGSSEEGRADLFGTLISAKDGAPSGPEFRIVASPGHAHAPRLSAPRGAEAKPLLAWLESDPASANNSRALFVHLSANGRAHAEPQVMPLPAGASDISLSCDGGACRALALVVPPRGSTQLGQLWGIDLSLPEARGTLLCPLWSEVPGAVVPTLLGSKAQRSVAYFSDWDPETEGFRLKRWEIDWKNQHPSRPPQ